MTGVDIFSSQIMDDLFAIFNGVPLVIAIKYNIHTSASFFPRWDSYLKTACNWELFSELIDSSIYKQTYSN